ncbi:Exosome complex exonuclease RRP42 [Schistosoma japonicum]|nr:Exosome complex exonuclease RRP42 [Schistosoma japonicum]KAH8860917.1 Exosome complex exonuclease RRP42 [Schistosoma japonicum]
MDTVLLSDLERFYLIQGIEVGCRMDGRGPSEYRPLEIETDILSHATGSASIRIGETFIVCCVKMEVGKPSLTRLNEGRIEINVDYPTATYRCNEKGASELAERLKTTLQSTYQSEFINLNSLCIQRGRQCWVIYIDLLILEGAGNLLDASSLVIKAALLNATQSNSFLSSVFRNDTNTSDTEIQNCNEDMLPLFVTVHKIGNAYIIDATKEEEACSLSRLSLVIYPDGSIGFLEHDGCCSCQLESIVEMSQLATTVGKELNHALIRTLELEKQLRS